MTPRAAASRPEPAPGSTSDPPRRATDPTAFPLSRDAPPYRDPTADAARLDRRIVVAAVLSTASSVFPAFVTGSIGVQLRESLGFGASGLGVAAGSFFAAAALGSVTAGRLAQRLGATRAIRLGLTATGLIGLGIAAFADSLLSLVVGVSLAGIANSLTQPAANLLLTGHVPTERLGLGIAIKQAGMPTATLLAGLAVPSLALTVGWRWTYVAGAALAVVALTTVRGIGAPPITSSRHGRPHLSVPRLTLLAGGIAAGAFAAGGLAAWLVSTATEAGVDEGAAGVLLSVGSAMGITSRLIMGRRADRTGLPPLRTAASMLILGGLALPLIGLDTVWLLVAAVPVAFAAGWAWPGLFNLAVVRANPDAPAAATGATQTGTYLGALTGPLALGVIVDQHGYAWAWLTAGAAALLGATLMLVAQSLSDRGTPDPASP